MRIACISDIHGNIYALNKVLDNIDENNVDLEVEKVNQASNSLQYNALITLTSSKLAMAKSVIKG